MTLPAAFAEFYSDVDVFQTGTMGDVTTATYQFSGGTSSGIYALADLVEWHVYAWRDGADGRIYSVTPAYAFVTTLNVDDSHYFTWPAVSPAAGYRILRNLNGAGWSHYIDVDAIENSLFDTGLNWNSGNTVAPTEGYIAAVNGDAVSKLEDQSGNARHLVQSTAADRPIFTTALALNGHNPALFDGVSEYLKTAAFSQLHPSTWFAVVRMTSLVSGAIVAANSDTSGASLGIAGAANYAMAGGGGPLARPASTSVAKVIAMRFVNDAALGKLWVAGTPDGPVAFSGTLFTELVLGCNYTLGPGSLLQFAAMSLYHLSIYGEALSDAQIALKQAQLTALYAL